MTEPVIWLPFDPADLGDPPEGLRYLSGRPTDHEIAQVEFWVPPYQGGPKALGVLGSMPRLRVVQTLTAGVDHIRRLLPEGVVLCNGRGIHDDSTAELALTLVLASLRGIPQFVRAQERGQWDYQWCPSLADRRVLIVGYGQIGAAIEQRLLPFAVADIARVARRARPGVSAITELPRLLPDADVVILIVPGTDRTRGLVDEAFLASMRPGALLVNVSRGPVVDTGALVEAVRGGRIRASLDVTDPEPLPADHPLWTLPGVFITPHRGGHADAFYPRIHRLLREQLTRFAAGERLANIVAE